MGIPARNETVDDLHLIAQAGEPTEEGQVRNTGADIRAFIGGVVVSLLTGSGISAAQHEVLDTLTHRIAENAFTDVTRDAQHRVTDIIVWTTAGMTVKIRETNIARVANKVSSITQKQYDGAGALIAGQTLVSTIARDTAGRVEDITHVES